MKATTEAQAREVQAEKAKAAAEAQAKVVEEAQHKADEQELLETEAREAADALATALYERLFPWLVARITASMGGAAEDAAEEAL